MVEVRVCRDGTDAVRPIVGAGRRVGASLTARQATPQPPRKMKYTAPTMHSPAHR